MQIRAADYTRVARRAQNDSLDGQIWLKLG